MSLTSCIKKAGGALSPSDKSTILARARELRSDGMAANDAAIAAVDELLAHVQELVRGARQTSPIAKAVEQAQDQKPTEQPLADDITPAPESREPQTPPDERLSRQDTQVEANTTDTIRAALVKRFGNQIARLEKRNFLKIWPSTQAFNDGQNSRLEGPAQGYWDGKTAHLFADGIAPGNEVAVLLHEVGEHASMEAMLGPRHYGRLVERAYDLLEKGDDSAVRAMDRIPDDTPAVHKDSEFLAYMIETVAADGAQATPGARKWLADIVAAIRAWFATTGLNKTLERYGQGVELTPADIAALAARAVAWQAEQDGASGRSTKPSMATNNVVGNNQGGRSADDTSPGAWAQALPRAGTEVDGRTVRSHIPNRSSIDASIANNEVLRGVRSMPLSAFDYDPGKPNQRILDLAEQIKESGEINPLIVGIDSKGPYIIEGGHRLDALIHLGAKELPALVVIDRDEVPNEPPAPDTRYSRKAIVGQTNRQHTPEQLRAMHNVGFQVDRPTVKERAQALWKDAGKKVAQGIVDQFAPVKALDGTAYGLLRLSKGASGAFESFLHGGKLKLTGNVYDFDDTARGGVIDKLLIPLQGEHHDFMRWVAANRAERLAGEGREKLFTPQDIADLKTLANGNTGFDYTIQTGPMAGTVTRNRKAVYADALRVFNEFNKNILDMAEQSGLIDAASRKLWEHEFYVPFYRVADENDGGIRGANIKGGVVRQEAFKALKGGKNALNADLLDNTLMNWAHLLDASAKNRAAKATIEAAERMGVAAAGNQSTLAQMATSINNKHGVVWFMDQGVKRYSLIDDPYIMTALTALEFAGMRNPVMNAMVAFKHVLTVGVTASPYFKVRNLIRDSVQVLATSSINPNPVANIAKGWALTSPKSDAYFRLLAGGGTIHFGTMLEGSEAKRVQALVESGIDDATLLNGEHKVRQFYRKFIEPSITAYNELGNRGEAINRASLYDQLIRQGVSHADASLQARDLMDFSMNGSFTTIRFLTQTVPFLNARLQGLYKLGRAAKEDPARFSAVLGAVTIMSLGLLAAYGDDDDWKKREEWDRNNYWWFKFGGTAFRIPKPFEIGAIATLAERGFELAFDKEMTTTRFRKQVLALLEDNLSMNPVPQLIKPIVDVYANKDSFSGRPIETLSMERLKSKYRFTDRTTMVARAASTGLNAVTGLVGAEALSPVQIDHMLRGYFGWLGAFVVGSADVALRPATGQPTRTKPDYWKTVTGGIVSDLSDAPSRYVTQMYEQAKEIEQAYGTWRALQKEGKQEEARKFADDNREKIAKYRRSNRAKHMVSRLNERIRAIERSDMAGDLKRLEIRKIQERKDRAARMVLD